MRAQWAYQSELATDPDAGVGARLRHDSRVDASEAARPFTRVLALRGGRLPRLLAGPELASPERTVAEVGGLFFLVRGYAIEVQNRRQFLAIGGAVLGLTPVVAWFARSQPVETKAMAGTFPVEKTDAAWRELLTPQQYRVLRGHGTERPFSSPLDGEKRAGTFACAACDNPLYSSATKYDSRTGWPSFWDVLVGAVGTSVDRGLLMIRVEVHCARCGGHLGHVFPDGPPPTGQRYCMNGVAMAFHPDA